ncbi:sensor domain-containing diguanylate cyclase [Litorilituus sediminis]|uniref:Sensor domain-containing diguanylate cyclase n=1 Tax=Litorilituus sediminis TaxID=718192 RepID=A0A4P6P7A0_9GAMM|nr:sensor domain-containing diguanylate cyclase [Litorilituus sediminis]QBG36928.1 sensor domain-containing diguanylate cyclase [Litorilituus sediminis]
MTANDAEIEYSIYRLFEITPTPIVLSYPDGKLEYVNPALKAMLGYQDDDIYEDDVVITYLDDIHLNKKIRQQLLEKPFTPIQIEKRYQHKLGHAIYTQLNIVAQANEQGIVKRYIAQLVDLTSIKKLDAAEILLNHLVNQSNDAIYVVDPKFGQFLNCNELAHRRLGYSKDELLKLSVADIRSDIERPEHWQAFIDKIKAKGSLIIESEHVRKDGTSFPVEANISFTHHHNSDYLLSIVRDISRRKQKEREAIERSNLDPLTKLPNRRILEKKLEEMFAKAKAKQSIIAFMYVDLDNFKQINDNFGHSIGDDILVGTANRLKNCVRQSDIVTRLGGDEFLIVMSNIDKEAYVEVMAAKVLKEFASPFKVQKQMIQADASIGVSIYMNNNNDAHTLIQLADEAMYQAKKQSGSSVYYL